MTAASSRGSTLDRWPNDGGWGRYFVIDVFTDTPLEGNQLGVFPEAGALSSQQMLSLAREMSFSETLFALPPREGGHVRVRIFTPNRELAFAGHPVLGCAFLVGSTLPGDVVRVETGVGVIPVELQRTKGRITFGRMRQRLEPELQRSEGAGAGLRELLRRRRGELEDAHVRASARGVRGSGDGLGGGAARDPSRPSRSCRLR